MTLSHTSHNIIIMDDVMFSRKIAYVVYDEVYGRGMSVSGRQRREGGASALQLRPCLRCLPLTDITGLYALPYTTEFGSGGEQFVAYGGQSLLS